MLNEKLTWHFSPSLKNLKAYSKKIPNKHIPHAVELNVSLSDKVKSNMWVFGIWTLKSSITNPLELSSFHLSYWSMGVLNRKIYHLYISDLKPIYEEGDVYNTENEGLFSNLLREYCECGFDALSGHI